MSSNLVNNLLEKTFLGFLPATSCQFMAIEGLLPPLRPNSTKNYPTRKSLAKKRWNTAIQTVFLGCTWPVENYGAKRSLLRGPILDSVSVWHLAAKLFVSFAPHPRLCVDRRWLSFCWPWAAWQPG